MFRKLLFLSLVCLAVVNASTEEFDTKAWIPLHFKEHEALQSGYSEELPSCGDNFFSLLAVEKEAACFNAFSKVNGSQLDCLPECNESWVFNSLDCETELINLQVNLAAPIVEAAKNGTMEQRERDLVEAMILQLNINGTAPGFLSTEEKAKEFFSSKGNLEIFEYLWPTQEDADQYVLGVKACLAAEDFGFINPSITSKGSHSQTIGILFIILAVVPHLLA